MNARRLWWFGGGALVLVGGLAIAELGARPEAVPVVTAVAVPPEAQVAQVAPADRQPARSSARATPAPPAPLAAPAEAPAPKDGSLQVTFDGRPLAWTKEEVRAIPRQGGSHDMRELVARLLGDTNVMLDVAGTTEDGERRAAVNLAKLGPDDELRVWPDEDGTWIIARNTKMVRGEMTRTEEAYRLTGIRRLSFKRN